jgi:cell wall-associated NlpC family hydrolase
MSPRSWTRWTRHAIVLCTIAAFVVPGAAAGAQAPPKPFEEFSASAMTLRDSIVQIAKAQVGTRYRRGGQSPQKGFDCSGLIKYIMSALNLDVPRTARQQAKVGLAITRDTSRLLPGDVLTFGKTKAGVSHVGIYVGDGKYIHASTKAGRVIETSIDRPFSSLTKMWRGARRLLTPDDTAVIALAPKDSEK